MTHSIPDNPDALLTRDRVAEALTEAGFPIKAKTLATKATRGGGPPFSKFGPRDLDRWGLALAWAKARLTAARHSTSEHDAASIMTSLPTRGDFTLAGLEMCGLEKSSSRDQESVHEQALPTRRASGSTTSRKEQSGKIRT